MIFCLDDSKWLLTWLLGLSVVDFAASQTCSASSPTITLNNNQLNAFQRSSAGPVSYAIPYTQAAACNGTVSCLATADSVSYSVATNSTAISVTIQSSTPLTNHTVTLNCSETLANATVISGTRTAPIVVFASSSISIISSGSQLTAIDAISNTVSSSLLRVSSTGNVPTNRLCYSPQPILVGSFSLAAGSPSVPTSTDCLFTQAHLDAGQVSYNPVLVSRPGSSDNVTVTFLVWDSYDKASSTNYAILKIKVNWTYYPVIGSSLISITAGPSAPTTITAGLFGYFEAHSLSGWDLIWTVPDLGGYGQFEYYCPDSSCGSVGWTMIGGGNQITFGWIIMNAFRWNPRGQPVNTKNVTFTASIPGDSSRTLLTTLKLTVASESTGNVASVPYQSTLTRANCPGLTVGVNNSGIPSLPFESFTNVYSPVRPICMTKTVSAYTRTTFGDLSLTVPATVDVTISGWLIFSSSFSLPTGFNKIQFTGNSSVDGVISSAFYLNYKSSEKYSIRVVSPPVYFNSSSIIGTSTNVAVLRYDLATMSTSIISITSWNTAGPYAIDVTISGPGVYIFGMLDNSLNTVLPITLGETIQYMGGWSQKALLVDSWLKAYITSSKDATIKISIPQFIISDADQNFVAVYDIASTLGPDSVRLEFMYPYQGLNWSLFQLNPVYPNGGHWVIANDTSVTQTSAGFSYSVDVSQMGQWSLIAPASSDSQSLQVSGYRLLLFITISTWILL